MLLFRLINHKHFLIVSFLPYSLKEGLAGFRRAKFATFTSTSAMAVALVLIGLFAILSYRASQVSEWLRERAGELEVYLVDNVEVERARLLHERASATLGVANAEYISPEQATQIFQDEFGEGAEIFFDEPFLPPSIRVRVESRYTNPDSLQALITEFESWNRVSEVVFNEPVLARVHENLNMLNSTGLVIGAVVVLAAIFLVANTIRLTIYARRLLIRTMKLVGATDTFIRRPFIVEGILQGLIAGMLASALVVGVYSLLAAYLPQLSLSTLLTSILIAGVTLAGIGLGWIGSALAVRRFIRNVQLH